MRTALLRSMQQISPSAREGPASRDFQYILAKDTGTEHHASQRARILSDPRQEPPPGPLPSSPSGAEARFRARAGQGGASDEGLGQSHHVIHATRHIHGLPRHGHLQNKTQHSVRGHGLEEAQRAARPWLCPLVGDFTYPDPGSLPWRWGCFHAAGRAVLMTVQTVAPHPTQPVADVTLHTRPSERLLEPAPPTALSVLSTSSTLPEVNNCSRTRCSMTFPWGHHHGCQDWLGSTLGRRPRPASPAA